MTEEAGFAEFVVADDREEFFTETFSQFPQRFARALQGGRIAHADEFGVAGIIAVGDDPVGLEGWVEDLIQKMIVREGIAKPVVAAIEFQEGARERVIDCGSFVADAGFLRLGGVMNVAANEKLERLGH